MRYTNPKNLIPGEYYQRDIIIERAIFEMLLSSDMQPGDSLDFISAQHQIVHKGISRKDLYLGLVHLKDRGLLEMREYRFYLTTAGFDMLNRVKHEWFVEAPGFMADQLAYAA